MACDARRRRDASRRQSPASARPISSILRARRAEDLIEFDGEGGFHLKGRADRVTKIEGIRVSLPEFEALLEDAELECVTAASSSWATETPYLGGVVVLDACRRRRAGGQRRVSSGAPPAPRPVAQPAAAGAAPAVALRSANAAWSLGQGADRRPRRSLRR